jgi:O-acetyl-ADP-ribose deacetylase (regulator of RNase III)
MLKLEFKESTAVLLILAALAIGIAVIGTNPLDPPNVLDNWARFALGGLGGVLLVVLFVLLRSSPKPSDLGHTNSEYDERFRKTQERIAKITPENTILAATLVGKAKFDVINGNILDSRSDVIVSSDDNHFSARGGVAKAILGKAGTTVAEELALYRRKSFRQGEIVITTGGDWECRAIIHPAVIDLDENRYPTTDIIRTLVRRSLNCALALGSRSISFPVLGGGTASKNLKPSDSVRVIVDEILVYLNERKQDDDSFSYVALYVYDKSDASGLPQGLASEQIKRGYTA